MEAEAREDFLESFRLCVKHLERDSRDPDALALMSRLCRLAGDLAAAIVSAALALRIDPNHALARTALDAALAQRPSPERGLRCFQEALALEPEIAAHAVCYGSAPPFERTEQLRELLGEAIRFDPALAQAHAALATVLARQGQTLLAIRSYRAALDIDPQQPDAALALSELFFDIGDSARSAAYRTQALAQKRVYLAGPRSARAKRRVLVLNAPAPWAQNTPLEFMVDPAAAALQRVFLTGDLRSETLPPYDVLFNAIGESESAHDAIARAERFIESQSKPVLNTPKHLAKTARPHLAGALRGVFGCVTARTRRITREELHAVRELPVLARPIDTHAGRGLERLDTPDAIGGYLARYANERFDVSTFVDYRSADGYYRKYRVVLVDGKPYPYHLAISPQWMVHYIKTPTASVEWMRAEEERFLSNPRSAFANWDRTFTEMAQALALDYAGVDCTLLPDGNVLVFEADTAMLVHCREPADSYKHQYVPLIFRAVEALLAKD